MNKYYYEKVDSQKKSRGLRIGSLLLCLGGLSIAAYVFFPIVSWQLFVGELIASEQFTTPIPTLESIFVDYTDAKNWFPKLELGKTPSQVSSYTLSIPKLGIAQASVSTQDYNLAKHLVHYGGTPLPGERGNTVVFGHSTLPQLFNKNDYKTIFANLFKLRVGDTVEAEITGVMYRYRIEKISVVDPDNTSVFSQSYDRSSLTLVTCTPPGTVWKRLIVKGVLETL